MRGELRFCPECRRPWPRGAEYDLRSFRWLDDLPRRVSPSNIDCLLHDGANGRSRFLVFETKRVGEDMDPGQEWMLRELAGLAPDRLGVRLLRGSTDNLTIHPVSRSEIAQNGTSTTPALVRSAVSSWLNGSLWRNAEGGLRASSTAAPHVCAWAARDGAGVSRCVHCGATWGHTA